MRLPFCAIDKKLTFATPRVLIDYRPGAAATLFILAGMQQRQRGQPAAAEISYCAPAYDGLVPGRGRRGCVRAWAGGAPWAARAYMATLPTPQPLIAPSTPTPLVRGGSLPVSTA
jgi:hypothetical protein